MATSTETVWAALLDRLSQSTESFKTFSRHPQQWGIEQLPAIVVLDGNEDPIEQEPQGPLLGWRLHGTIHLLSREPHGVDLALDKSMLSELNGLIAEVRTALEWDPAEDEGSPRQWTDLGGLVENFAFGTVTKGGLEGVTGQIGAEIPIEMDVYITD